ncbi:hypothetical protein HAX54_053009, partial [Datura stramonium]|nr:hypothetical protein [Datura stramonium]
GSAVCRCSAFPNQKLHKNESFIRGQVASYRYRSFRLCPCSTQVLCRRQLEYLEANLPRAVYLRFKVKPVPQEDC